MSSKRLTVIGIEVAFVLLLVCSGGLESEIFVLLLFGWFLFLTRVIPAATLDWAALATGAGCLILLAVGMHYFCSWLLAQIASKREQTKFAAAWKWRWTMAILGAMVLMFVAGIAVIGSVHTVAWLRKK